METFLRRRHQAALDPLESLPCPDIVTRSHSDDLPHEQPVGLALKSDVWRRRIVALGRIRIAAASQ
jgi:hypothetical protein